MLTNDCTRDESAAKNYKLGHVHDIVSQMHFNTDDYSIDADLSCNIMLMRAQDKRLDLDPFSA